MAWLMFEGLGVGVGVGVDVGLMFERVNFRSDLGFIWVWEWFQIWCLKLGFDCICEGWMILWGFENNKSWTFGWLGIKLVRFNIFLRVWLILV